MDTPAPQSSSSPRTLAIAASAGVAVLLAAFIAWFVQTPTSALLEVKAAAQKGDVAELDRRVDFPALRASVKALLVDSVGNDPSVKGRPAGGLAKFMAAALGGPVVDAMVTPQAIALMFSGVLPTRRAAAASDAAPPAEPAFTMTREWDGLSAVRVRLRNTSKEGGITFLMRREGLATWRLAGIER